MIKTHDVILAEKLLETIRKINRLEKRVKKLEPQYLHLFVSLELVSIFYS